MANVEDVLAQVPIFSMLKPKDLKSLTADAHDLTYPAGTTLADTDELGSTFFVVVEGTLRVLVDGKQVRSIGPGDFFGEMALIDHEPRSATIVTDTDVRCLVFSSWVFRPFALKHSEVAWALLEVMVARIREAEKR
ncbi:MAG TPA: Crp/Fnr family transcriptional regulator [Acidimicrobiales bacterium]|jgi:CRP-like cAMP-binding protein